MSATPLLTDQMRAATKSDHDKSDKLVNLKLALVLTSPALYGEALGLFLPVFETMESIIDRNSKHPQIGKLHPMMDILRRTPGFRSDLEYYLPGDRRQELEKAWKNGENAVIKEYVEHLEKLEKEDPVRVLAYAYHLNGGVLAGGQIISRMVRKAMGLPNNQEEGVMVFKVKDEASMSNKGVFQKVKSIFNEELELSAESKQALIQEGKEVFRLNNALVSTVKGTQAWDQAADAFTKKILLICCVILACYFAWHVFALGSGGILQHGY
ncbi:Heme oxygenase 2 [Seminavis robusta]|uniref:Heme oxygenase 2 n=1 Tax=Seminavis robusta TaxID=568900 RepID=A0A9N8DC21_9STRA|nr:Heme oxygenase 2 [Seminavis robusta]|eukprot:Sro25_g016790.1 Heme oxygenase 2 (268) ;mRNA; f:35592-36395